MSDWHYPPFPCCGGLAFHRGGPSCDEQLASDARIKALLTPQPPPDWHAIAARFAEAVDAALDCTDAEPAHLCVTCRAQLRTVLAEYDAASGKTGGETGT